MLLLTSTADLIKVVTDSAATVDVHASFIDVDGSNAITPGRANTAISSAATTTVVPSPGAGVKRNVKLLTIRNTHATLSATCSIQHSDGTTTVTIYKLVIAPDQEIQYSDITGFVPLSTPVTVDVGPTYGPTAGTSTNSTPATIHTIALSDDTVYRINTVVEMRDTGVLITIMESSVAFYRASGGAPTQEGGEKGPPVTDNITVPAPPITYVVSGNNLLVKVAGHASTHCRFVVRTWVEATGLIAAV